MKQASILDIQIVLVSSLDLSTPLLESSPVLLAMITTVRLVAGHKLNNATTLTTLSGMVRAAEQETHAVTEEDHGSVSSYLSQLEMTSR